MTHTLILTNSTYPDKALKAQIESIGLDFVHSPALSISYFDIDVSPHFAPDMLIVTSKHAIHRICEYNVPKNIKVVCVGETTKQQLISNGFTNIKRCFENGSDLIEDIKDNGSEYKNIVYLRGRDVQHDIKNVCSNLNIIFDEYIVYESIYSPNFLDKKSLLVDINQSITFCIFSKKGADSLADNIKSSGLEAITRRTNILCLSESMISSLGQFQWKKATCCTSPTRADFLKQLSIIKKD